MASNLSIAFFIWNLWLWSYHQISTHLKFHLLACRFQPKLTALSSAGGWILSSRGRTSRWKVGEKKNQVPGPKFRLSAPNSPWEVRLVFFFFSVFAVKKFWPTWRDVFWWVCFFSTKNKYQVNLTFDAGEAFTGGNFFQKKTLPNIKIHTINCQGRHLILGQDHVYDLLMNFLSLKKTWSCVMDASTGFLGYEIGQWVNLLGVKNQNAKISSTRDLHHFRQNQCHLPRTPKFKTFPIPFDHIFQGPRFNHLLTVIFDGQLGEG